MDSKAIARALVSLENGTWEVIESRVERSFHSLRQGLAYFEEVYRAAGDPSVVIDFAAIQQRVYRQSEDLAQGMNELYLLNRRRYRVKGMESGYFGEHTGGVEKPLLYISPERRSEFVAQVEGKRFVDQDGFALDTDEKLVPFVMDQEGRFYIAKTPFWNHSQFLSGEPVASAGDIELRGGRIVRITNRSGHYRPSKPLFLQAITELKSLGIPVPDWEKSF